MRILESLWDGSISPSHRKSTPAESALLTLILKNHEKLAPMLSPEAKKILDELMDEQGELASMNDCEIFIEGFRMGARLMLEVMAAASE